MKDEFDSVSLWVSEYRELSPEVEVPYMFIPPDEYHNLLLKNEEMIDRSGNLKSVYKMLGIIDKDTDLLQILANMSSSLSAALYAYELEAIFIISGTEEMGSLGEAFFAHEYTHALQDQHFNMESLLLSVEDNSDKELALRSILEGDAERVETAYLKTELGVTNVSDLFDSTSRNPEYEKTTITEFILKNTLFPYRDGLDFVNRFDTWESLNEVYSNPPQSTEQILHPEKYLESEYHDDPEEVILPDLKNVLGGSWDIKYKNVLGEFLLKSYLEIYLSPSIAAEAAEGWGGDRIVYLSNSDGEEVTIMYSVWDFAKDALEFRDAYRSIINADSELDSHITGTNIIEWQNGESNGYMSYRDAEVLIILAQNQSVLNQVKAAFR